MTALPHLFMPPAEPLVLSQSSRLATLRPNWNWPASDVMAVQILLPQRASALVALANDLVEDLAKQTATTAHSALVSALTRLSCITSHDDHD